MKINYGILFSLMASFCLIFTGCEDDEDIDHDPPAGMGSIVVDNRTYNDINVFIDGIQTNRTSDKDWRAYDLAPGVYRVVLDEDDGDRNFRGDVDVLENQLTIMDVEADIQGDVFDVYIYFK